MSRAQQTSTVEQNTGGAVAPFVAGKNKVINGDFGIWQRGTTFNGVTTGQYTADRWVCTYINGTVNITQQAFTAGAAPVAGYESAYYMQVARTSTAGIADYFSQKIENVRTFAGQTVTVSFWAKGSSAFTFYYYFDQNFGSGGSTTVSPAGSINSSSVTTSWQRYSGQITIPSISGETVGTGSSLILNFKVDTPAGNITLGIWGVQVEAGSVATPFTTASGTLQGELSLCQRYYWQVAGGVVNQPIGNAWYYSSSILEVVLQLPVTMRIAPSIVQSSGTNYFGCVRNGGVNLINSFSVDQISNTVAGINNTTQASGTAGQTGYITIASTAASLAFSAEL